MYYVARIKTYSCTNVTPSINVEAATNDLDKARALAKALEDICSEENVSYKVLIAVD